MKISELIPVHSYDANVNPSGSYSNIFVQNGCSYITDDFVVQIGADNDHYRKLIQILNTFDQTILAGYTSSSLNGNTFFHYSSGIMNEYSVCIFFRLYAAQTNSQGAIIQQPGIDMPSIVFIQNAGTLIKLRTPQGDIPGIVANNNGTFTHLGISYRAIMEVIGVGEHAKHQQQGDVYDLSARNESIFQKSRITLSK